MNSSRVVFLMACIGLFWAASSQVVSAQGPFGRSAGRFGPMPGLRPFPGAFPGPRGRPIPPAVNPASVNLGVPQPGPLPFAVRPPMGPLVPGWGRGRAPAVVLVPNTQVPRSLLSGPLLGTRNSAFEPASTQRPAHQLPNNLRVYQAGASSYATARPNVPSAPSDLRSSDRIQPEKTFRQPASANAFSATLPLESALAKPVAESSVTNVPSVPGTSSILEAETLPLPPPVDQLP